MGREPAEAHLRGVSFRSNERVEEGSVVEFDEPIVADMDGFANDDKARSTFEFKSSRCKVASFLESLPIPS